MRRVARSLPFLLTAVALTAARAEDELSPAQQEVRRELSARVEALEKAGASGVAGADGWLFLTSELRFLAQGRFWGDAAAKASRSHKAEWADPIPAIADFHRQLHERGIELLVVPVPPKAAIYPEKIVTDAKVGPGEAAPYMQQFYAELRARGIEVLDLTSAFSTHRDDPRGPVFCRTDSHWSGVGCVLAGEAIANAIRDKVPAELPRKSYDADWKEVAITGDLTTLVGAAAKSEPEKVPVRIVAEKVTGASVQPDANSPLLVLGDSHTLAFHEFLAERAGLIDQLAHELGFAPDLIGTRGSGATAVRISLYRKGRSEPGFLAKKKIIVWCFAAREFTEADQGWVQQPIGK